MPQVTRYYGNDLYVESSHWDCRWVNLAKELDDLRQADDEEMNSRGRFKRVKVSGKYNMIFGSVGAAAKYARIAATTMSQWCRDGKEHNGSKWIIIM